MARKPKAIVLDSWAVMAYLEDEPAGEKVENIIADAHENNIPLMMSIVNEAEIWYLMARQTSEQGADEAVSELKKLGIEFFEANWKLAHEAARFKAKHKMSLADCFAAALAKDQKADLVTGDHEFKQIEDQIRVSWV